MREIFPVFLKKVSLFLALSVLAVAPFTVRAQQTQTLQNDYVFSTGVATYRDWLAPTPLYSNFASGCLVATASSPLMNLGFDFIFEGRVYNTFSINNCGNLRLGNTQGHFYYRHEVPLGTSSGVLNANYNIPKIVPLGGQITSTGRNNSYGVYGTAPNRVGVYTFEGYPNNYSRQNFNYQIQLYEGTGEIRIVYGSSNSNTFSRSFQIGIAGSGTDVVVVNPSSHTISYGPSNTTNSNWPGTYRYYSFVPRNIGCTFPYNLSTAHVGRDSVLLNWDAYRGTASTVTYIVEYGLSGFIRGTGRQIATSTKPIYIGGLQPEQNYTFYVRAVCDTLDTSAYSRGADFLFSTSNMNTCLDFTALNSPNVTCTYGTFQNYNNYTSSYPGPYAYNGIIDNGQDSYGLRYTEGSRHTVHTRVGEMDSCSGYRLSKIPPGESKSVRLGCVYGHYICQSVSYDMIIDTNKSDILVLKYACVFYNPDHTDAQQPRFVLEILDSVGNFVNFTCGSADFNSSNAATSAGSGWQQGATHGIYWKDWTPVGLHLAAYHNQHIKVRLTSYACGLGADDHFGYAYYTLSCAKAKIRSSSCVWGAPTTLSAPMGFNYEWYSSQDTLHPFSSQRSVTVNLDSNKYYCIVSFIDNPNCKFRVSHTHRFVGDTTYSNIYPIICAGSRYIENGDTLTTSGVYSQALKTAGGCDSVLNINLFVRDTLRDTIHKTLCAGVTFDTNGHLGLTPVSGVNYPPYYLQGVYTQYLRDTVTGCYHNLVIDLTVNDTLRDTIHPIICAGTTFDTNGHIGLTPISGVNYPPYYLQGVYTQYFRDTATGCYHNLVIDLTVNDTIRDTIHPIICAGTTFDTNGHLGLTPVSGVNYPPYYLQGVYTQNFRDTATGCYHNLVIDLTVNDTLSDTIHPVICAGATFDTNGHLGLTPISGVNYPPYYLQGVYTQYFRDTATGCYHNLVIDLTVNDTIRDTIHPIICAGAVLDTNGHLGCVPVSGINYSPYYLQGIYTQYLRDTVNGCYQNLVIDLIVNDTLSDTIHPIICAGAVLDTNGHLGCVPVSGINYPPYYLQGVYTQYLRDTLTGCYRNLVIDLTVNDTLSDTIHPIICAGAVLDTNGHLGCVPVSGINYPPYYLQGVYTQYLRDTATGCYHNLVIDLKVSDTIRDTIRRTICAGAVLDANGHLGCVPVNGVNYPPYYLQGVYTQYLRDTATGCYHNLVIDLKVNDTLSDTIHPIICAGAVLDTNGHLGCVPVNGVNYPPYYLQGVYTQYLRDTATGCYHNLVIDLTVNDTLRDTIRRTICAGAVLDTNGHLGCVPVNGVNYPPYYLQGVYTQYLRDTATGCYHNLVIDLKVSDTIRDTIHRIICAGATFDTNGEHYSRTGFYSQLNRNASTGCYSRLYIDLTVSDTVRDTIHRTICAGAVLDTNGQQYSLTGFYTQLNRDTITGCFTRLYIDLTVSDTIIDTIYRTICAGAVLDTNGRQYSRTGFYTQFNRDATTGCFSRLYINLSVNDTLRDTIYRTVCAGAVLDTNGHRGCIPLSGINYSPYYLQGVYTQYLQDTVTGCFQNLVIDLKVRDTILDTIHRTICAGAVIDTNGRLYSKTGFYSQLNRDASTGCYSRLYIDLSVNDTLRDTIHRTICAGAILDTNGRQYSRTGFYSQLNCNVTTGCYTRLYIDLTVSDTIRDTINRTFCAGSVLDTNGIQYVSTGVYHQYLRDSHTGCRSNLVINLTVNDTFRNVIWQELCAGNTFSHGGQNYSHQGTYFQQRQTIYGCDSLTIIHITVNDTLRDTLEQSICAGQSLDLNGQSFSATGWYRQKLRTTEGCDSILHINLTVNDTLRDTLYFIICTGKSVELNGHTYSRKGWYRQDLRSSYGCDSILTISVRVDTPAGLLSSFKMKPQVISLQQMQIKFSDYSSGNAFDRKWLFHEIPDRYLDEEILHKRFVYYTPHYESDSLQVTLIILTDFGCSDTTTSTYPILKGDVWVPGAFTPNADENQTMKVGCYDIDTYEIIIYSRSGLRVYHSTDPDESWDGTYKGRPCPAASYVYHVKYTTKSQKDKKYEKNGSVLLIR